MGPPSLTIKGVTGKNNTTSWAVLPSGWSSERGQEGEHRASCPPTPCAPRGRCQAVPVLWPGTDCGRPAVFALSYHWLQGLSPSCNLGQRMGYPWEDHVLMFLLVVLVEGKDIHTCQANWRVLAVEFGAQGTWESSHTRPLLLPPSPQ